MAESFWDHFIEDHLKKEALKLFILFLVVSGGGFVAFNKAWNNEVVDFLLTGGSVLLLLGIYMAIHIVRYYRDKEEMRQLDEKYPRPDYDKILSSFRADRDEKAAQENKEAS